MRSIYVETVNPAAEWVWSWSRLYPDYTERMAAMAHPRNVANAFEAAEMMRLIPLKD